MDFALDKLAEGLRRSQLQSNLDLLNILSSSIQKAKSNASEIAVSPDQPMLKGLMHGLDFAIQLIEDTKSVINREMGTK